MKKADLVFHVRWITIDAGPPRFRGTYPYVDAHCPVCDYDVASSLVAAEDTIDAVIRMLEGWAESHLQWHQEGCPEES